MKLFLKLFAGLVVLLIVAVVLLITTIDPNDYKQQIQTQVKKSINRDLAINGDISWAFYPQLGFSSGEIELRNLDGFNRQNLLKIDQASLGIDLVPLLKGQIKIGELTVNGLVVNLITNKNGRSNLDNMQASGAPDPKEKAPEKDISSETEKGFFALENLQLAGININDAQIEIQDLKAATTHKANIKKIQLGKFSPGQETDLSVQADLILDNLQAQLDLQSKLLVASDFSAVELKQFSLTTLLTGETLPNGKVDGSINTDIKYDLNNAKAELTDLIIKLDKIQLSGQLSVQTKQLTTVRFALKGNQWDFAPYLPEPAAASTEAASTEKTSIETTNAKKSEQEPDLSILNSLDINGTLSIEGVKASGLTIGKINSKIIVNKGKAQLTPLTAELYQGLLTMEASIEERKGLNSYQISSNLNNVQIRPLLIDAAEIDFISGTTDFNFAGKGQGLTASKIKKGLTGKGDFKLLDGELYGINLSQEVRILKAKLTAAPQPTEANIKKTDFASLTGNFTIDNGIVDNQKLLMLSPVMRLDGSGLADILKETLDYRLSVTPLSKSTEKTELGDLSGLVIPLLIKGPFSDPKFTLDTEGAIKERLTLEKKRLEEKLKKESQQRIEEQKNKLEDKVKDKLGDKLKNLFG
ncbi:outer membrane protein assembly protein AsmA [Psychromonas ingrahamii 37]|uniref:Outer membrane protein assembly protein AsmA n=1 Tax=Psychromonas ingrahamii (strain DSM 17664 / CCUG 51855 / 37) TaxID=357804 RepID=A1STP3_PSYIN|nr:AsmA family protein [Psychromonas ingrahamii]ABM02858.1 outer membrane protein assembly protein AsmA [Psychromonas ingrahamii 37]